MVTKAKAGLVMEDGRQKLREHVSGNCSVGFLCLCLAARPDCGSGCMPMLGPLGGAHTAQPGQNVYM